jgi:hypothetical protein
MVTKRTTTVVVAGGEVGVTLLGNPDASSSLNDGTIDDDDDDDVDVRDEEKCVARKKKIRITRVLFVGDGDFSLSRAFAGTEKGKSAIIVATSLSSESDIEENWKGRENVLELRKMANVERVAHGIDATRVEDMMRALRGGNGGDDDDDDGGRRGAADAVVFAFPHLPGKGKISKNRELLRNFLLAARDERVMRKNGACEVALAPGQGGTFMDGNESRLMYGDTWKAYDMGADVGMALVECERFNEEKWRERSYKPTGHWRGLDDSRSFRVSNAVVHRYKREEEVSALDGTCSRFQRTEERFTRDVSLAVEKRFVGTSAGESDDKTTKDDEENGIMSTFAPEGERCAFAKDGTCAFAKRCDKERKPLVYTRLNRKVPSRYFDAAYRGKWCCGKCYVKISKVLQLQKQTNGVEDTTPEEKELLEKIRVKAMESAEEIAKTWKVHKNIEFTDAFIIDRYDPKDGSNAVARNIRLRYFCERHPLNGKEVNEIQHALREKLERGDVEGVTMRWYRRDDEEAKKKLRV